MSNLIALKPAERIVDSVYAALRSAILDGTLPPGHALSVPELSRRLDVSRTPVREAVLALVTSGLAVEQPRRGVAVAEIAARDLLEIHEIREGLEGQAAELCAQRAGPALLKSLAQLLECQRVIVEHRDADGWFRTNADFHRVIAEGAGNRRLSEVLKTLEAQMRLGLRRVAAAIDQQQRGLAQHKLLYDAIGQGDVKGAGRVMRTHIRQTRETLASRLSEGEGK